jgi:hypothetical protein
MFYASLLRWVFGLAPKMPKFVIKKVEPPIEAISAIILALYANEGKECTLPAFPTDI